MKQEDMSPYVNRNLRHHPFCEKCGRYIEKYDDVEYQRIRIGRRVAYKFYHSKCMEDNNESV